MKRLRLARIATGDLGTSGVLVDGQVPVCLILEEPWRSNQTNVSCIPAGDYLAKRIISPKFGETFEITRVPQRSEILFHRGNWAGTGELDSTKGCLLNGLEFGQVKGQFAVKGSKKAFEKFMKHMDGIDSWWLSIRWNT